MKKLSLISLLCFYGMLGETSNAQRAAVALFSTADDFYNRQLSEKPIRGRRHIIRINEDFRLPFVTVVEGGAKRRYPKDSLFGYLNSDGTQFRFFRHDTYEVLNRDKGLMLYRQASITGGKAPQTSVIYYFSKGASASIKPLSREALSDAFSRDDTFLMRLYESFPDNGSLPQYDDYLKAYKLVSLFEQTHK